MATKYYKIASWSGKGGVGKTAISRIMARLMHKAGKRVGLVDMDITNPNIATGMGLPVGRGMQLSSTAILPYEVDGLKVMSLEFLREADYAMLFDGMLTVDIAMELLDSVDWGDIEVLVVDMEPGTSDLTKKLLSVMGKKDGVILVTTPEPEALVDAVKTLDALKVYDTRLMGMIVNKSYVQCPMTCPACGAKGVDRRIPLGASVRDIENRLKVKAIAEIPLCVKGQRMEDYIDINKVLEVSKPRFSLGGF